MKKVSIIIPTYNEEESLPLLYDKLKEITGNLPNYIFEFLFINDGSKDKTLELIKNYRKNDSRICYVDFSRNFGQQELII